MQTRFIRISQILLAALMLFGVTPWQTFAQSDDRDALQRIVVDIVRAETRGDYGYVYDYLLPDIRNMMPRQAYVTWHKDEGYPVPTSDPEISDIEIESGEDELTGIEFDEIATVGFAYESDDEDGTVEREMRFARVDETWRLTLDLTRRDRNEIDESAEYTVEYESKYSTEVYVALDTYWAQVFADAGVEYRPAVDMIGVNADEVETDCGTVEVDMMGAMYCTADETIYYDPEFRDVVVDKIGDYAWRHIMAHEWAHHVQNILGITVSRSPELSRTNDNYSVEHELQADCLAAVFTQDAFTRELASDSDVDEAEEATDAVGDPRGVAWDDPQAHGSGQERVNSFWLGYEDGLRGCHLRVVEPVDD